MRESQKTNPKCPRCGAMSIRWGMKVTKDGLVRRFQCTKGHIFLEPREGGA